MVRQYLAFVCRVSSHVARIATALASHHEIDLRNPEVFLNFRALRGEYWYPASSNSTKKFCGGEI